MTHLLRTFIHEALLHELRRDHKFITHLRTSGLGEPGSKEGFEARRLADDWLRDVELELGRPLRPAIKAGVRKFVERRWAGLRARFKGDEQAAQQTLSNLLNTKYVDLRTGD